VLVDADECLQRYGLRPDGGDLDQVREILRERAALERREQGDGDTAQMRLCYVQLFNAGFLDDVLAIWHAKEPGWDAHRSIDVQLLRGAGLEQARQHLAADGPQCAREALDYLLQREAAGHLTDFSVEDQSRRNSAQYPG
jgi:hypothetical protein